MRIENQALKRLLSNNPLAETYAKEAFLNMGEQLDEKLADFLYAQILAYSKLTSIKDKIFAARDIGDKLEVAIDLMPGLPFAAAARFKAEGRPGLALRQLQIAALDSGLNRYREAQGFINGFLASVPFSMTSEEVAQKMDKDSGDETFLPRIFFSELAQIGQGFLRLPTTSKRTELIEYYYLFQATSQIFFQFYFELLLRAPSDLVVSLIDRCFSYLLASLRRFEINHFLQAGHGVSAEQIEFWIEKDAAAARHPTLRKHIFAYVNNYSPILRSGETQQSLTATGQRILQGQMESIRKLSVERLTALLLALRRYRGKNPVIFILTQFQRGQVDLLEKLEQFLGTKSGAEEVELHKMVTSLTAKVRNRAKPKEGPAPTATLRSYEAQRLMSAQKRLASLDTSKMLNQFKVADYLKERLSQLYERARIEGAMTKDKIPGYLAQFADASSGVFTKKKLTPKELAGFAAETEGLIEEIGVSGGLSPEEVADKKESVQALTQELAVAETDEQKTEILNQIGGQLMDTNNLAEEKLPPEKKNLVKFEKLKDAQIIPVGLDPKSAVVTVGQFMSFPLGNGPAPSQEDWYNYHLSYLHILLDHHKLTQQQLDSIEAGINRFERCAYKKYFDIFPNDKFDESVLSAVYSLWENNGLARLKLSQSA